MSINEEQTDVIIYPDNEVHLLQTTHFEVRRVYLTQSQMTSLVDIWHERFRKNNKEVSTRELK